MRGEGREMKLCGWGTFRVSSAQFSRRRRRRGDGKVVFAASIAAKTSRL